MYAVSSHNNSPAHAIAAVNFLLRRVKRISGFSLFKYREKDIRYQSMEDRRAGGIGSAAAFTQLTGITSIQEQGSIPSRRAQKTQGGAASRNPQTEERRVRG